MNIHAWFARLGLAAAIWAGGAAGLHAQPGPFPATNWPATVNPAAAVHYFVADANAGFVNPPGWKQSLSFVEDGDQAFETFFHHKTMGLQSVDNFMNIADTEFQAWSNSPAVDVLLQVYGDNVLYNDDGSAKEITLRIGALDTENPVHVGKAPPGENNGRWNWLLFHLPNDINSATGARYLGNVPDPSRPNVENGGVNNGTVRIEGVPGITIRAVAIGEPGAFGDTNAINVFGPATSEWIAQSKAGNYKRPAIQKVSDVETVVPDVEIGTGGGRPLHANLAYPKQPSASLLPAVIWIHGGAWEGGTYQDNQAEWLVRKGYFTASIEYRLSDEAKWPAQIEDCKLAVRWLRANAAKYNVDPDRIGVLGQSAGGHLAACLGTMADSKEFEGDGGYAGVSSRVQAVADLSGPADFTHGSAGIVGATATNDSPVMIKLFGGDFTQLPEVWRNASPVTHISGTSAPFLVVHGEKDNLVPIAQSESFVAALKAANVPVEFVRVKNGDHTYIQVDPDQPVSPSRYQINADVAAFFDKYLKK